MGSFQIIGLSTQYHSGGSCRFNSEMPVFHREVPGCCSLRAWVGFLFSVLFVFSILPFVVVDLMYARKCHFATVVK